MRLWKATHLNSDKLFLKKIHDPFRDVILVEIII